MLKKIFILFTFSFIIFENSSQAFWGADFYRAQNHPTVANFVKALVYHKSLDLPEQPGAPFLAKQTYTSMLTTRYLQKLDQSSFWARIFYYNSMLAQANQEMINHVKQYFDNDMQKFLDSATSDEKYEAQWKAGEEAVFEMNRIENERLYWMRREEEKAAFEREQYNFYRNQNHKHFKEEFLENKKNKS